MLLFLLLLVQQVAGGLPGTYCSLTDKTYQGCSTGVCRGPWKTVSKEKLGVCCLKNVGDGCIKCRLVSSEDNVIGNAGICLKAKRHLMLKDGKAFNKCQCLASNKRVGERCCPLCAKPCSNGECVQRGKMNLCEAAPGEYEYVSEPPHTFSPSKKPTAQPTAIK